jgi:hypothetical protein
VRRPDEDLREAGGYALSLANKSGYDEIKIVRALLRHEAIAAIQVEQGPEKARTTALRKARWALERARTHPKGDWRSEVPTKVARYREAADSIPWPGRTGATDRRTYEGVLLTGLIARSSTFGLAARTAGWRTGMLWTVANYSMRRLETKHMIRRLSHGGGPVERRIAAKYRLLPFKTPNLNEGSPPPVLPVQLPPMLDPTAASVSRQLLQHDAFRNRALGDVGWQVVRWLDPFEPIRADVLAGVTGISRDRVRRVLGELHRHGVARPVTDGWVRILDADLISLLDVIAWDAGTVGALARDAERYERERHGKSCALFVQLPGPEWWATWWGSLSEEVAHAA